VRIFFLHPNFPAQFRNLAAALGQKKHQVYFLTANKRPEWEIPGVSKVLFSKIDFSGLVGTRFIAAAAEQGKEAFKALMGLKAQGIVPDLICAHSGWGCALFVRDVFPETPFLGYFEWYYAPDGLDACFDSGQRPGSSKCAELRCKNLTIEQDLLHCDAGLSPTKWQKSQFPKAFQGKINCLHEGIDTSFFCPGQAKKSELKGLEGAEKIITYAARGLEPTRGFPQFMSAMQKVLHEIPGAHAVIMGSDRVPYGTPPQKHSTYREQMLAELDLDLERIHFTGPLPYGKYKEMLRLSDVHVYLTRPFVLSWSLLEAMACGCLIVGSNTPPVREVLEDGVNGLLADFNDAHAIGSRIADALYFPSFMQPMRQKARQTIEQKYALQTVLPRQLELINRLALKKGSGPFG
jgi:glycosyltransferase involved in cell wall biosynthesis